MKYLILILVHSLLITLFSCNEVILSDEEMVSIKEVLDSDSLSISKTNNIYELKLYSSKPHKKAKLELSASNVALKMYQNIYSNENSMLYNSKFDITYIVLDSLIFNKSFDLDYLSKALETLSFVEEVLTQLISNGYMNSNVLYPLECRGAGLNFYASDIDWTLLKISEISFIGIKPDTAILCHSSENVEIYWFAIKDSRNMILVFTKEYQGVPKIVSVLIPNHKMSN